MKIIDQMPARAGIPQEPKYPWLTWLDGQVRLLEPGVDFDGTAKSIQAQAAQAGRKYGVKVSTRLRPEGVYLQALPLPKKKN